MGGICRRVAAGIKSVVVVSDDGELREEFMRRHEQQRLVEQQQQPAVPLPHLTLPSFTPPADATAAQANTMLALRDLHLLMHAQGIIQQSAHGWSALSNLASLLRDVPLISTYKHTEGEY